jgi:hypothetical protein
VVPVLVRIEMLRTERTYELLITQHRPGEPMAACIRPGSARFRQRR